MGTVLVFTVTNHEPVKSVKVMLTFTDESREGESLNFRMPVTSIPVQVHSNRDKEVVAFTKLRAFEDWGRYSFTATVENPNAKHMNRNVAAPVASNMSNMSTVNNTNTASNYDQMDVSPATNMQQTPDLNQKECPACTYYNMQY